MSSSMGFRLTKDQLKKGITLDKVLGGGFKKIEIGELNVKELEGTEKPIEQKVDELSDPEALYRSRAAVSCLPATGPAAAGAELLCV